MIKKSICALVLLSMSFCNQEKKENSTKPWKPIAEETKPPVLNLKIIRVEQEMFKTKTKSNIKKVLNQYPLFSEKFLKRASFPNDSILVNGFYRLITNKSIDTLYNTCQQVFGDFSQTGFEFQTAFDNIKTHYPSFKYPTLYTIITGMGNDLYISDSMIVTGLEFFLAEKSKYKPDFPKYIQVRYRKENIVPMCIAMISNNFNKTDYLDNSLIAEMVFFGKSYYFLEKTIPNISDTIVAGYTSSVLKDVEKNQDIIWAHFIDKKLLFETKHETVNRYIGERPATVEIGNKCPGRIGRWLGWQIVRNYMNKNPEITLTQLMKEKDAKKIFNLSKYRPKKVS